MHGHQGNFAIAMFDRENFLGLRVDTANTPMGLSPSPRMRNWPRPSNLRWSGIDLGPFVPGNFASIYREHTGRYGYRGELANLALLPASGGQQSKVVLAASSFPPDGGPRKDIQVKTINSSCRIYCCRKDSNAERPILWERDRAYFFEAFSESLPIFPAISLSLSETATANR